MKTETRKEEITRIAAVLFKEKGYSAVTMRDLATAIGIKAASLYNHIHSKQEILTGIIISLAEEFTLGMDAILSYQGSSLEKIEKIVELHVRITSKSTYEMASLNNDWMHLQDQLSYYMSLRANYENNFRTIVKQGVTNGEIITANPEVVLFSVLSTLRSLYLWIPYNVPVSELSKDLNAIIMKGIKV